MTTSATVTVAKTSPRLIFVTLSTARRFWRRNYFSIHNITFLLKLVKDARKAIFEDRFADFKQEFYAKYYGNGSQK